VALHDAPLRISEHYNSDCATLQILLRRHIFVGRQEHFKTGFLGGLQQPPFTSLSQPASFALVTVWPSRNEMRGAGVP